MLARLGRRLSRGFALLTLSVVWGCAPGLGGRASFPVVSKAKMPDGYEKVADLDERS